MSSLLYRIQTLEMALSQNKRLMAVETENAKKLAEQVETFRAQADRATAKLKTADERARAALEGELAERETALQAQFEPYRRQYEKLMADRRTETRTRRATDVKPK